MEKQITAVALVLSIAGLGYLKARSWTAWRLKPSSTLPLL